MQSSISKYRITKRVGGGSFGDIYLGVGANGEKVRAWAAAAARAGGGGGSGGSGALAAHSRRGIWRNPRWPIFARRLDRAIFLADPGSHVK